MLEKKISFTCSLSSWKVPPEILGYRSEAALLLNFSKTISLFILRKYFQVNNQHLFNGKTNGYLRISLSIILDGDGRGSLEAYLNPVEHQR